jgi:PhnB protein
MDAPPGNAGKPGDNFAIEIMCPDELQIKVIFAALKVGGTVMMPLDKTFFSPFFGMLRDRYGTIWMISAGRSI